jgi:uncharacterized protein
LQKIVSFFCACQLLDYCFVYLRMEEKVFLTAQWQNLIMLNYEVPKEILLPHLPPHTELDLWKGKAIVSVVGFMFQQTKVFGFRWPFHTNFEEVNLRFYVKHFDGKEWKRGVAFVSEIVPSPIISFMANKMYNEHYSSMRMKHKIELVNDMLYVQYQWKHKGKWNNMKVVAKNELLDIEPNSEAEFIFEHYWGYNGFSKDTTIEYAVEHPRWQRMLVKEFSLDANIEQLYGAAFVPYMQSTKPQSVFLAKGSDVLIRKPKKILG